MVTCSFAFAGRPVFNSPTRAEIISQSEWIAVVKNLKVKNTKLECGWGVTLYNVEVVEIVKAGKTQSGLKPGDTVEFNPHPSSAVDCALREFNKSGASFSASRYKTEVNIEKMKSKDEFIVFLTRDKNGWSLPADNAFEPVGEKEAIRNGN